MVDSIEYESSRTTPFGLNGEGLFDAEGNNFPDGRVVREYADLDLFFTFLFVYIVFENVEINEYC